MGGSLGPARRFLTETLVASLGSLPGRFCGSRVAVCLSGGADSCALALAVSDLGRERPELLPGVSALHVRHHLRGSESEGDAASVRELCGLAGLPLRELDAPVEPGPGLEARARVARYGALRREAPGSLLATAHHRDDQAETVVLRLLRGAGPRGLVGIRPIRQDGIWRPLLACGRDVLSEACREADWIPRQDSSNADRTYSRNEIRWGLLPDWEQEQPGTAAALADLARAAWELEPFLERALDRLDGELSVLGDERGFTLDLSRWPVDRPSPETDSEFESTLERAWTRRGRRPWTASHRSRLIADLWQGKTGRRRGGQAEIAHFGGRKLRVESSNTEGMAENGH
jgi:tRNA(Ile)-lysidine synthase